MQALQALENFLTYLRLHKGRSMRTLEQYEFHIWRLLSFLEPRLPEEESNHREVWLDIHPEKRMENRRTRIELKKKYILEVEEITKEDILIAFQVCRYPNGLITSDPNQITI